MQKKGGGTTSARKNMRRLFFFSLSSASSYSLHHICLEASAIWSPEEARQPITERGGGAPAAADGREDDGGHTHVTM